MFCFCPRFVDIGLIDLMQCLLIFLLPATLAGFGLRFPDVLALSSYPQGTTLFLTVPTPGCPPADLSYFKAESINSLC